MSAIPRYLDPGPAPAAKPALPRCRASGKHTFTTWAAAKRAAKRLHHRCGDRVHAFKCERCKGYHVGSVPWERGQKRRGRD